MEINLLKLKLTDPDPHRGGIYGISIVRWSWKYRPVDFCCENMKDAFEEKLDKHLYRCGAMKTKLQTQI